MSHINHAFRDYRVRAAQISTEQDSYRILCWRRWGVTCVGGGSRGGHRRAVVRMLD